MAVVAPPLRALIYVRQSKGSERSIAEQEVECREVCGREGWEIVDVLTDYVGASRRSKGTRTGWAEVKRLIGAAEVDVLATWEASRTTRDLGEFTALRDLCASAGVMLSYGGSTYDMGQRDGRFRSTLDAVMAEDEAERISDRIKRATRANAAAGKPHGRVCYGFERIYDPKTKEYLGQVEHPTEAPIVREVFGWYLSGVGVRTIARRLNERGVRTRGTKHRPDGVEWTDAQVRRMLVTRTYAGQRVHNGTVVGDGDWPALIALGDFERVQARLVAQRTSQTRQRRTPRLLTSVARCGKCGGKIMCGHDRNRRKVYLCQNPNALGEVARDTVKLDQFVTEAVLERLSRLGPEALDEPDEDDEVRQARERVEELRQRLDNAAEQYAEGKLSAAMLAKVEAKLTPQIAEAEREARAAMVPISLEVPTGDLREWWDGLEPEQRREVVGAVISTVVIKPTRRGVRTFDPSAVEIVWR